jgi:hypothetical protein
MKVLITEDQLKKIISLVSEKKENFKDLNEQTIEGKGSDPYDYKKVGNKYYYRKNKGGWVLSYGESKVAIAKKFGHSVTNDEEDKKRYYQFFKSKAQSSKFRNWVNKWYPKIAKEFDLDPTGPFDNLTIRMVAGKKVKTENGMKSLGSLFFKEHKKVKFLSDEPGQTLPSLVKTGFKINKENWSSDEGYYVDKCTQEGCAQYTYDMIGDKFGDAWQAYKSFNAYLNVSSSTVKKMEVLFNNINKVGFPSLNEETQNDIAAKNLLISLTPNQNQFKNLELGSVVGLYYPNSSNYDLAFFESAIGKAKDNEGNWVSIKNPYFCTDPSNFEKTKWTLKDIKSDKTFKASPTLKGGKSFVPNTHLGFIGYIDDRGERYVVHNVHKTVYAYPISKMVAGKTLSIIWSGSPVK